MASRLRRAFAGASRPARRRWRARASGRWATGPPDFVGVGAQRCGTTWWWRLVCDHPEIHIGAGKELHFFDRYFEHPFSEDDIGAYHRMFPRPRGSLIGEWTPRYMHDFWTPALLRKAAPDAKILVLLRDPMQRYQSGISHELDRFRRAVRGRRRRQHAGTMSASDALSRSLYGRQLRRLLQLFDRQQVLVLQYERCAAEPAAEVRRTYAFLGVERPDHLPRSLTKRLGRSHPQLEPNDVVKEGALPIIVEDLAELRELVPEIDLDLWPSCR
jgi:hypothetical protein